MYIHHSTRQAIRRDRRSGVKISVLAKRTGCTHKLIREICQDVAPAPPKKPKKKAGRPKKPPAQRNGESFLAWNARTMIAEGCDPDIVYANFGYRA